MAIALAPVPLWLAAISALPHKEERFLYVIYPLVCRHRRIASLLVASPCVSFMWAPAEEYADCGKSKLLLMVCVEPLHTCAREQQQR